VVAVADGEGVGERVLERDLVPGEVAHRLFGLGRHPVVPQPAVPGRVVTDPAVVEVAVDLVGEVAGEEVAEVGAALVGLGENAGPVRVGEDLLVAEPPDPAERPEVVIEGAILLHEDHHVRHVADGPAPARGQGGAAVRGAEPRSLEETASADTWRD
jgi:hypothetical protein